MRLLTAFFILIALVCRGASPTFQSFNTNQFDSAGNRVAVKPMALITNAVGAGSRQLTESADIPRGAPASFYATNLAGGGSGITELPLNSEIKNHLPKPVLIVNMTTYFDETGIMNPFPPSHTNLVQVIEDFHTNGLINLQTNGGDLVVMFDTWTATNRDASGNIVGNPILFPTGVSNTVSYAHTNSKVRVNVWADNYWDTLDPSAGNSARLCNIVGGGAFNYPGDANPNGTDPLVPIITPRTYYQDANQYYNIGFDGAVGQDINPYAYFIGYGNAITRKMGAAVLSPLASVYWAGFKNTFKNKGMAVIVLGDAPLFQEYAHTANGAFFNVWNPGAFNYNYGVAPINASGAAFAFSSAKAFNLFQRSSPPGAPCLPIHWAMLSYPFTPGSSTLNSNDYRSIFAVAAVTHSSVALGQPINYTNLSVVVTNRLMNRIWLDDAQYQPFWISVTDSNGILANKTVNRLERSVAFINAGVGATNLTLTSDQLGYPHGSAFVVTDGWDGSTIGYFTNSYTEATATTNVAFRVITLMEDSLQKAVRIGTNGLISATPTLLTLGMNGTNVLGIFSSGLRINTDTGAGVTGRNPFEVSKFDESSGSVFFYFSSESGSGYSGNRDTGNGYFDLMGYQAAAFTGFRLRHSASSSAYGTEYARITGTEGYVGNANINVLTATDNANQRAGNATLVGGTVTVNNTTVTANTVVLLNRKTAGGTIGNATYTLSAGASFTINSDSGTDTSTFSYFLIEAP